jgi:formiminotetrahydrofolate cyclodeaminase
MALREMKFGVLLDAIASKTPSPGGGAVAALTCAVAASLAQMVVRYSLGKKTLAAHDALHRGALEHLQEIANRATELADADAAAYARMNELWRLKEDDPRRQRELAAAVAGAIDPPRQMLNHGLALVRMLSTLPGKTSASLNSDLAIAAALADSAVRSAAWNVRINLPLLNDQPLRRELEAELSAAIDESRRLCAQVEQSCAGE